MEDLRVEYQSSSMLLDGLIFQQEIQHSCTGETSEWLFWDQQFRRERPAEQRSWSKMTRSYEAPLIKVIMNRDSFAQKEGTENYL